MQLAGYLPLQAGHSGAIEVESNPGGGYLEQSLKRVAALQDRIDSITVTLYLPMHCEGLER